MSKDQAEKAAPSKHLPSRMQQRNKLHRRILRYWREALGVLVLLVIALTIFIVQHYRTDEDAQPAQTWRDKIQVSGTVGRIPTLSISGSVSVSSEKVELLEQGSGREITADSPLIVAIWSFDGATGRAVDQSSHPSVQVGLASPDSFDEALLAGVVGKPEGSRVLFVRPVSRGGELGTEVNVVDALHSAASGEVVEEQGGPLKVTMTDTGPNISHDPGDPPDDLKVQMLVRGDGIQVKNTDSVLVQFVRANWTDSVVQDSTWWKGIPKAINLAEAMPGVRVALTDQRVGSRLALTIPSEMALGDGAVTMVIDIIAAQREGGTLTPSTTESEEVTS